MGYGAFFPKLRVTIRGCVGVRKRNSLLQKQNGAPCGWVAAFWADADKKSMISAAGGP